MELVTLTKQPRAVPNRIWLKAFWGFDPQEDGYLGFTKPGARERFIKLYEPGDLVLIYGADNAMTSASDRRQALGFLEVEPTEVADIERMSELGKARKIEMGCADRWTYAVPVRRAWRVNRRIEVKHIAPSTYTKDRARVIASLGELLLDHEARTALQLPVTPVNVFGEPQLALGAGQHESRMQDAFRPSHGIDPSFGPRQSIYEDGKNFLYMLVFQGDAAALLGRDRFTMAKKIIVKVGYSNDPQTRRDAHNAHLPPACIARWEILLTSRAFPSAAEAKHAEDNMKLEFSKLFESLGGEFFLGDRTDLESAFGAASAGAAFNLRAS